MFHLNLHESHICVVEVCFRGWSELVDLQPEGAVMSLQVEDDATRKVQQQHKVEIYSLTKLSVVFLNVRLGSMRGRDHRFDPQLNLKPLWVERSACVRRVNVYEWSVDQ